MTNNLCTYPLNKEQIQEIKKNMLMDSSLFEMFGYLSDLVNDALFDIMNFSLLVQSHGIHRRKYQSDCECHA